MHRLAADFLKQPVAVNGPGLATYRNPNFVLDSFGLGSEPVRKAKAAGIYSSEFIAKITAQHRVAAAMVYEAWFPSQLPPQRVKVARLQTEPVTAAYGEVTIFAIADQYMTIINQALRKVKNTSPERVILKMLLCVIAILEKLNLFRRQTSGGRRWTSLSGM